MPYPSAFTNALESILKSVILSSIPRDSHDYTTVHSRTRAREIRTSLQYEAEQDRSVVRSARMALELLGMVIVMKPSWYRRPHHHTTTASEPASNNKSSPPHAKSRQSANLPFEQGTTLLFFPSSLLFVSLLVCARLARALCVWCSWVRALGSARLWLSCIRARVVFVWSIVAMAHSCRCVTSLCDASSVIVSLT
mgnify:CR=1 FL=1